MLEAHGVGVVTEGCAAVNQNRKAIDQQLVLLDRFLGERDKDEAVKEHDVKHRLLIERLRGEGNVTFTNARYWFLTRDSKLPRYAMATVDSETVELPFCAGTSAWVQVMRAFTPRTEDFDKSLVELLATPYLRYRGGPGVSSRVVDAVIGRVDAYKGASPKLAAEVLADTALTESIAAAQTEADRDAQVEHAFIVKSEELRDRAQASEIREARLREQRQAAEEVARRSQSELKALHDRLAALESESEEQRVARERQAEEQQLEEQKRRETEEAERAVVDEQERRAREEREAERQTSMDDERKRRHVAERRLAVGGAVTMTVLALPVCVAACVSHVGVAILIAMLSAAALLLCGAVRLALGRERGPKVIAFLFGFSGIVGLIVSIVVAAAAH